MTADTPPRVPSIITSQGHIVWVVSIISLVPERGGTCEVPLAYVATEVPLASSVVLTEVPLASSDPPAPPIVSPPAVEIALCLALIHISIEQSCYFKLPAVH